MVPVISSSWPSEAARTASRHLSRLLTSNDVSYFRVPAGTRRYLVGPGSATKRPRLSTSRVQMMKLLEDVAMLLPSSLLPTQHDDDGDGGKRMFRG